MKHTDNSIVSDDLLLNYHLMHPGGDSAPGDPNVAFWLGDTCHLHYILRHPWKDGQSYSFIHVTSEDMLHWRWRTTSLQPSFTGHGMFSGTGFVTKEGRPAAIYCGLSEPRHSFIAAATDNDLSGWQKPYPVLPKGGPGGKDVGLLADPDLFQVGDTYYAFSAAENLPLCKSTDLVNWTYVGPFMKHDMPDVAIGEDLSCANFFRLADKWMLLCISHSIGCRYYLGEWDSKGEQFVPEIHGRMNWRRAGQSLTAPVYRDFFAPESVLTPDGRRVMWAWLATLEPNIDLKTVQSLPRELSLDEEGSLRILPLRELESLRYDATILDNVEVPSPQADRGTESSGAHTTELPGDSCEIRITVDRSQAEQRRFGFELFAGGKREGLLVILRPETGTICVGETEAPFSVGDLPEGQNLDLRIYIDKYLVEVFANGRQAALAAHMAYRDGGTGLKLHAFRQDPNPITIRKIEIWKLKPTNQGFLEARQNRVWAPDVD